MKRRIQLPSFLLGASAAVALSVVLQAATRPPNILFIMADDHAYQAISAYGSKLVQTPNIDRLAKEGMRFDRCLVPNSICGPSRATILTGKYSHKNGFYTNHPRMRFDGSQATFPKLLQKAGYQTAIIGKWHLRTDPTGFDYWHILPGQGIYYNPPMIENGKRVKHRGYVTDIITDLCIQWLEQRDPNKPFLLMCHHKAPHRPWDPPVRYLGHNGDLCYPEPPTFWDDYSGRGKAEHTQDMTIAKTLNKRDLKFIYPSQLGPEEKAAWDAYYKPRNEVMQKAKLSEKALVEWKYNRYLHDYLACIKAIDDSVGRLLKYLEDHGLADNTIVVYTSDQGFYLGEHNWFDKRWIFEQSLRTPLLIRWPGVVKPGSVCKAMVSNLDFAETFLDIAGIPIPKDMQGRSLLPILKGHVPSDWRRSFYYHYYEFPGPHHVRRHYGVVTQRYKLVHFYGPDIDEWELFDLKRDPYELRDVYHDPAYREIRAQLHAELNRLRKQLEVPDVDPPNITSDRRPYPNHHIEHPLD